MKKKILMLILLGGMLFSLTACGKEETDALKFKEEYESLNGTTREKDGKTIRTIEIREDNPFVYKEASDIVEMIQNKETFVVYFGFPDCPWCRSAIPTLDSVAADLELDTIYYVNVKEIRDTLVLDDDGKVTVESSGTDGYYDLLEVLDNVLADYTLTDSDGNQVETGEKRIYAPNIISVVDGVAMELTDGISDSQTDGYMELTKEMTKESYNKIKCSIQCVADDKKTCSAKTNC
jgi:thiol-disulfide isomerase/thioredoxin